jgi:hypothetical protein
MSSCPLAAKNAGYFGKIMLSASRRRTWQIQSSCVAFHPGRAALSNGLFKVSQGQRAPWAARAAQRVADTRRSGCFPESCGKAS